MSNILATFAKTQHLLIHFLKAIFEEFCSILRLGLVVFALNKGL